jgi:hypothetical protein
MRHKTRHIIVKMRHNVTVKKRRNMTVKKRHNMSDKKRHNMIDKKRHNMIDKMRHLSIKMRNKMRHLPSSASSHFPIRTTATSSTLSGKLPEILHPGKPRSRAAQNNLSVDRVLVLVSGKRLQI